MTTKRLDRIKHRMARPWHVRFDMEWLVAEVERLRAFVQSDYDRYEIYHPYAVSLREKFPWLSKAAEAAGEEEP